MKSFILLIITPLLAVAAPAGSALEGMASGYKESLSYMLIDVQ
jgi:hypothetical protein